MSDPESSPSFTGIPVRVATALALVAGALATVFSMHGRYRHSDFSHYYIAARIKLAGQNPYLVPLEDKCEEYGFVYDDRIPYGTHPPLILNLVSLVAWMPVQTAFLVWAAFQIASLVALLEMTRRILALPLTDIRFWLLAGLVINAPSVQSNFFYSQVQLFIAAGLTGAWYARIKGRDLVACGLIAGLAGFKLFPAVLLPWFVFTSTGLHLAAPREWLRRIAMVAIVSLAVVAVAGPAAWISFIYDGIPVVYASAQLTTSYTNYSLQAIILNILEGTLGETAVTDGARFVRLATPIMAIGAYVLIYWYRKQLAYEAPLSILLIVMIASGPVCWANYLLLLVPVSALLYRAAHRYSDRRLRVATYAVAILLQAPTLDAGLLNLGLRDSAVGWMLHYYPFYLMVAAVLLLLHLPRCPPVFDGTEHGSTASRVESAIG